MAPRNNPKKRQPLGQSIRELIKTALQDERRQQIQLDILDQFFAETVFKLTKVLEDGILPIFNHAATMPLPKRNKFIIEQLTKLDITGMPLYSPRTIEISIPLCMNFVNFSGEDIRELPGYINLHEVARKEDVALDLVLPSESGEGGKKDKQIKLIVNSFRTYAQGAAENPQFYPDLPELPEVPEIFDRTTPRRFKFGP